MYFNKCVSKFSIKKMNLTDWHFYNILNIIVDLLHRKVVIDCSTAHELTVVMIHYVKYVYFTYLKSISWL